jgi:TM2 domain-containing membrane protein YozV
MYCRNCAAQIDPKAVVCVHCGVPPRAERKFCGNCAEPTEANQVVCVKCGASMGQVGKDKVAAGILALLLGTFGIHKFYLGYNTEGVLMLLISIVGGIILCAVPTVVMALIALAEGIIYLTKSEDEFQTIYVANKRGWF